MANRSNRRQQNPRTAVGEKPELPMGSWRANSPSWPDLERSRSSRGRIYVSSRTAVAQDRSASKWGGAHIQPFAVRVDAANGASEDAAAASAARDVLVHYFPSQAATLDAALASSLASIADGQSKTD